MVNHWPWLDATVLLSSSFLRIFSYVFLRWIPGHRLPPLVLTSLTVYATSFYYKTQSWASSDAMTANDYNFLSVNSDDRLSKKRERLPTKSQAASRIAAGVQSSKDPKDAEKSELQDVLLSLLSGLPSPRSTIATILAAGTNVLLALMVLDLVFRGPYLHSSEGLSFIRVGYIDNQSAKLLIREPSPDQMPLSVHYRQPNSTWKTAASWPSLHPETDYTASFRITALLPDTDYEYNSSNGHSGTFTTAPPLGRSRDPSSSKLTFLASSCMKAHFPYRPFDHGLRIPGLEHLATALPHLGASFMLFLGDFIYVDVPLRFGSSAANYRREYRQVYASPSWPAASANLPWLHVMDDHEIANDWDQQTADPYPAALDPFVLYQHPLNPDPVHANSTYYSFARGPASFFLLETRRHRSPSAQLPADSAEKSMLGREQLDAVLAWLARPEPPGVRWKIMVSSVPFTRNWRFNALDTWAGYLAERQALLEAMWDTASGSGSYGVVVLSGDRHEFAATRFPAPVTRADGEARTEGDRARRWTRADGSPAAVTEFSCSPLNMFYFPFRSYGEHPGEESGVGAGGQDQEIAYLPDGNSKFGAVQVDGGLSDRDQSTLRYRLFVDGVESWSYVLTAEGR